MKCFQSCILLMALASGPSFADEISGYISATSDKGNDNADTDGFKETNRDHQGAFELIYSMIDADESQAWIFGGGYSGIKEMSRFDDAESTKEINGTSLLVGRRYTMDLESDWLSVHLSGILKATRYNTRLTIDGNESTSNSGRRDVIGAEAGLTLRLNLREDFAIDLKNQFAEADLYGQSKGGRVSRFSGLRISTDSALNSSKLGLTYRF